MATYAGKLKIDGTNELPIGSTLYGTCVTAAATAQKDVTLANFDKLITGVTVHVKFTYSNSVANPTLKVGSTAAAAIMRYGTTRPSTSAATSWNAGAVVSFTYDGTYWQMNDWLVDGNSNTWRDIKVGGTSWKGTGTGTGAVNFVGGTNVTLSTSGNDLTISASSGGGNANVFYGTCATGSTTVAKVGTCADFSSSDLVAGATISLKFTYSNSATSPTLNVNGTGAKSIMGYNSYPIGNTVQTSWGAGAVITFVYDGTNWMMEGFNPNAATIIQETISSNIDYAVLLSANAATQASDYGITRKNSNFTYNPSTGNFTTPLINNSPPVMVAIYGTTTYAEIKAAYDAGIPVVVYAQNGSYSKTLCLCSGYTANYISFWGMLYSNATTPAPYRFITARVSSADAWTNSLSSF